MSSVTVNITTPQGPEIVRGVIASSNYFDLLGVRAIHGRTFHPAEGSEAGPVVVLGHRFWQQRFAGDPDLVGRAVLLNGTPFSVIGIAPPGFNGPSVVNDWDFWAPLATQRQIRPPSPGLRAHLGNDDLLAPRQIAWLNIVGRLADGVSVAGAQASVDVIQQRLTAAHPEVYEGAGLQVQPFNRGRGVAQEALPVARLLALAVLLVLLIACANVANLLLIRGAGRRKEIGIRLALGAGRARIVRQLLTESLVLATAGGVLGTLIAQGSKDLLLGFRQLPSTLDLSFDARVFAFAVIVTAGTVVLFGVAPALQTARSASGALKAESASIAGGTGRGGLQRALVVAQVALSLTLLVGAGLVLRSLRAAATFDPGYDVDRVLVVRVDLDRSGYTPAAGSDFYGRLTDRLRTLPGVDAVSLSRIVPLSGWRRTGTITMASGQPIPDEGDQIYLNVVDRDYFRTLGTPVLRGREFDASDRVDGRPVVILSQAAAVRYWQGGDPVGETLQLDPDGPPVEVVGVVADSKYASLREAELPVVYRPMSQYYEAGVSIHLRAASGNPTGLLTDVRAVVADLDPNLPVYGARVLEDVVRESLAEERMVGTLLMIFGGVALLLATIGVYGVMSYAVNQRTQEVGVRRALGARNRDIVTLIVGEGLAITTLGVTVGLVAAVALSAATSRFLFGGQPARPWNVPGRRAVAGRGVGRGGMGSGPPCVTRRAGGRLAPRVAASPRRPGRVGRSQQPSAVSPAQRPFFNNFAAP